MANQPPFVHHANRVEHVGVDLTCATAVAGTEENAKNRFVDKTLTTTTNANATIRITNFEGTNATIPFSVIVIYGHNFADEPLAQVRVRLYSDSAWVTQIGDTGLLDANADYAVSSALGDVSDIPAQRMIVTTQTSGGVQIPGPELMIKSLEIELTVGTALLFWEVGWVWVGTMVNLSNKVQNVDAAAVTDRTATTRVAGGGVAGEPVTQMDVSSFGMTLLTADDKATLQNLFGATGTTEPWLLIRQPGLAQPRDRLVEGGIVSTLTKTVAMPALVQRAQTGEAADSYSLRPVSVTPWR